MKGFLLKNLRERLERHATRVTPIAPDTHPVVAASIQRSDEKVRRNALRHIRHVDGALEVLKTEEASMHCDDCGTHMRIYDFGEEYICGTCKQPMRKAGKLGD